MTKISIIVAIAENNAIGKNNDLLWHIPEDLKRFKKLTNGHTVVMGRNTFLSLPIRPLPNRRNIVISDNPDDNFDGCIMATSVEQAINLFDNGKENFIIGGGMIYKTFFHMATRLYLTLVHKTYDAGIYFPEIDYSQWDIISKEENSQELPEPLKFTYLVLQKNNS